MTEATTHCGFCDAYVPLSEAWHHRCAAWGEVVVREQIVGDLVETVARAIALEEGIQPDNWQTYVGTARAAVATLLAHLREPTVEMIGAGAVGGAVSNDAAAAVWGAMVEAVGR